MSLGIWEFNATEGVNGDVGILDGLKIEVRRENDGGLATIYEDALGHTPLSNPFSADDNGSIRFFADNEDLYRVKITKPPLERTLRHQPVSFALMTPSALTCNVKDFGAAGDGTTDDTSAIQNGINQAAAAGGGMVSFPPGTYLVTGLTLPSNVTLLGVSRSASVIRLADGSDTHVIVTTTGATDWAILDLGVDGNKANQNATSVDDPIDGIRVESSMGNVARRGQIRRCHVFDVAVSGISLRQFSEDIVIEGNLVERVDWVHCINLHNGPDGASRLIVVNNICRDAQAAHIAWSGGIPHSIIANNICDTNAAGVGAGNGGGVADCITGYHEENSFTIIKGNVCRNSHNHGIHVGGFDMVVSGNLVENVAGAGIFIGDTSTDPATPTNRASVTGNCIKTSGGPGIFIRSCRDVTVTGNTVVDAGEMGIFVHDEDGSGSADFCTLTGNTIIGSNEDGIQILADRGVISANVCRGNGDAGIAVRNGEQNLVVGNRCRDNATWGIEERGSSTLNVFEANNTLLNTSGGISLVSTQSRVLGGWGDSEGVGGFFNVNAAGNLHVPADATGLVRINAGGATNVDTIQPCWAGRVLYLWFNNGNTTLRHARGGIGQLFLSGGQNLNPNTRDIVQLVCTGSAWLQASPRVNNG